MAEELRSFSPASIWCSREPKAIETAQTIAEMLNAPLQAIDGLEEHHRNSVPFFPTQDEFELAIAQFFRNPDKLVLGEETAHQALHRFTAAINRAIKATTADTTIIVTHGTVMTLYVASVAGVRPICFWRGLETPSFVVLTPPEPI